MCNEVKCEICGQTFKNLFGLSPHVGKFHKDISKEEYYLKYMSTDPKDGYCHNSNCTNKTKFGGFGDGFRRFCSMKCMANSDEVLNKKKQTCLEKYGAESPLECKEITDKIKQTTIEKYGCEYHVQREEFKQNLVKHNLEKFGVPVSSQNEEVKEKMKQTNRERYGCDFTLQNKDIREKGKNTIQEKYGVDNVFKSEEIKEKIKETNLEKYGVEYSTQNDEVREKAKQTNLERYGCENPSQLEEVKEKIRQTNLEKYGVSYGLQNEEIREKGSETVRKKFYESLFNSNRLKNKVTPMFTYAEYKGSADYIKHLFKCNSCNTEFDDFLDNGRIPRCPTCYPPMHNTSYLEQEIFSFIQQYFPDAENGNRTILNGKELDIYIPSKQFAIEFDGLYWHSELNGRDKYYHLNKTNECLSKGIQLIHIFEDEWLNKEDIIKSIIKSKLGLINNSIYARNCEIREINNNDAFLFLDNNHLQGSINGNHVGLCHNNELVSLLTYGKPRFNSSCELEILRFCNKLNTIIIGGLSKLIGKIPNNSIITYSDGRFGTGKAYIKCGFELINKSDPSYYYIDKKYSTRYNRLQFQKHLLESKLESFDSNLTEWQNMQLSGYDRIWDCGNYVFEYKK